MRIELLSTDKIFEILISVRFSEGPPKLFVEKRCWRIYILYIYIFYEIENEIWLTEKAEASVIITVGAWRFYFLLVFTPYLLFVIPPSAHTVKVILWRRVRTPEQPPIKSTKHVKLCHFPDFLCQLPVCSTWNVTLPHEIYLHVNTS